MTFDPKDLPAPREFILDSFKYLDADGLGRLARQYGSDQRAKFFGDLHVATPAGKVRDASCRLAVQKMLQRNADWKVAAADFISHPVGYAIRAALDFPSGTPDDDDFSSALQEAVDRFGVPAVRLHLAACFNDEDSPMRGLALDALLFDERMVLPEWSTHVDQLADVRAELREHFLIEADDDETEVQVDESDVLLDLVDDDASVVPSELRAIFAEARLATERISYALANGSPPNGSDLDVLQEASDAFSDAVDALDSAATGELRTIHDIESRLHELEAEQTGSMRRHLERAHGLSGPAAVSEQLGRFRAIADSLQAKTEWTQEEAALARSMNALVELTDLAAAAELSDEKAMELDGLARTELPAELLPLVTFAAGGKLWVYDQASIEDADPVTSVQRTETVDAAPEHDALHAEPPEVGEKPDIPATELEDEADEQDSRADVVDERDVPPESQKREEFAEVPADADSDRASRVDEALSALIAERRFGLAQWIARRAGQGGRAKLLAVAALASEMRSPYGECALRISQHLEGLSLGDLAGDRAFQALGLVAAIRAVFIAPWSGALQLVLELDDAFQSVPALRQISEAIVDAARRDITLATAVEVSTEDVASIEDDLRAAVARAETLLAQGPTRTVKFQRATRIWRDWLRTEGPLGEILTAIANDARGERAAVRSKLAELSDRRVDHMIDEADDRFRGHGSTPIVAGARAKLQEWLGEVVAIASDWTELCDRLEARSGRMDWQQEIVHRLRELILRDRDSALDSLRQTVQGQPCAAGCAAASEKMLSEIFDAVVDHRPILGDEPSADAALNAELLTVPAVAMEGMTPLNADDVPIDSYLEASPRIDWRAAFEARSQRGDHTATGDIVGLVRQVDLELAEELSEKRDAAIASQRAATRDLVETASRDVDRARRYGYLDEDEWNRLSSRLRTLGSNERVDFDRLREEVDEIVERAREAAGHARTAFERRLATLATTGRADDGDLARIQEAINAADLITAEEYFALVEAGEAIPERALPTEEISDLLPIIDFLQTQRLDRRVTAAITQGEKIGPLRFDSMPAERREWIAEGLDAWLELEPGKSAPGQLRRALSLLGIEIDNSRLKGDHGDKRRAWIELNGVQLNGKALVPTFGSEGGTTRRVLLCAREPSPAEILNWINREGPDQGTVVLYSGLLDQDARRTLAVECRKRASKVVVIDDAVILFAAARGDGRFDCTMRAVLPYSGVNPFRPFAAGMVPPEMFYGRAQELASITDLHGTSFIYGGRQLGKSALLHAAEDEINKAEGLRAVYVDLRREGVGTLSPAGNVWSVIRAYLAKAGIAKDGRSGGDVFAEVVAAIDAWLATSPIRRLVLLLDEADSFLDADSPKFENVLRLKGLLEDSDRRFKPVFAGLHQVQRFQSIPNQPFAHLGDPIAVGPLPPQAAFDLLHRPLEALGYRFESDDLVSRILGYCNYQPSLIQLYGNALMDHLLRSPMRSSAPPYEIRNDDVQLVYDRPDLLDQIKERFELTLQLDTRYLAIAYTLAFLTHVGDGDVEPTATELREACTEHWPAGFATMTGDDLRVLLEEMVGLGVLDAARAKEGRYRFRSPNVLRMLGTEDQILERLNESSHWELPRHFDARSYRRSLKSVTERSPLTEQQLRDVTRSDGGVRLIIGSQAVGIHLVRPALEKAAADDAYLEVEAVNPRGKATLQRVKPSAREGVHKVYVVDLRRAANARLAMDSVTAAVEAQRNTPGTGVVFVAGTENVNIWRSIAASGTSNEIAQVELKRWDELSLRAWLGETELPFQEEGQRAELLAVSGGWPSLVELVASKCLSGASRQTALSECRARLADGDFARQLLEDSGLTALDELFRAWRAMLEYGDPISLDESLDLLDGVVDAPAETMEILRALSVLDNVEGRLRPEPVLGAASQVDAAT